MNCKKYLLLCVLCALPACVVRAQSNFNQEYLNQINSRFDAFEQQREAEFKAFSDRQNEEFAAFMERQWQVYEDMKQTALRLGKPKMPQAPVMPGTQAVETPIDFSETMQPTTHAGGVAPGTYAMRSVVGQEGGEPVYTPLRPQPGKYEGGQVKLDFYGQAISIPCSQSLCIHARGSKESDASAYFRAMSKLRPYTQSLWQAIDAQAKAFGLNQWGYFCLLRSVAETILPDSNDRVLFIFYMLRNEGGFKAKLARGRESDKLTLLLALDNDKEVYSYIFFRFQEADEVLKYYSVYGGGTAKESIYSYAFNEQDQVLRQMSLDFDQQLQMGDCDKQRTLAVNKLKTKVLLPYNSSHMAYLDDVPMTVFPIYFRTDVPTQAQQALYDYFNAQKHRYTQVQMVALLLDFVQTAFAYKTDEQQFGYEKYFYPEEVIAYPYSDCEDRSALFSWLVQHLTTARVLGLQYEGHVATAVSFDEGASAKDLASLQGDAFSYGGRKYYICDPTYVNASIGVSMPEFKNQTPDIIKLKK